MLTAQGSIESAVEAMRMGAFDYLAEAGGSGSRLRAILESVSRQMEEVAATEVELPSRPVRESGSLGPLVGSSPQMRAIYKLIERVAPSNVSVLVTGESGTGKELVARSLHELSGRRNKPFVAVNCAAIPETLIESEIFGHEKGAFTGALERRAGCFELAEEGTLLLDEIGEMPAATQAKLLRVLEDRKLRRLGSKAETPVDVRVIAATNKDPERAVAEGELRGRSVLPAECVCDPDAAAAGSSAGCGGDCGADGCGYERAARVRDLGDRSGAAGAAEDVYVAGQCAGAAQHDRTGDDHGGAGAAAGGSSAAALW